ncbi:hypothetical protein K5D34_04690 [Pseudomonas cichorii]|uniref:Uncharacterized protein n=1 Tax=Pseudomonas lijiangensis TaxID=2995658 RepID=A0ABX8HXN0_9PSED|nr:MULTISPECIES: hypothetical protein [Pseudomonas syringae group]MBX8490846.1 hypothetical protein [Pseudomonas cichorii]MBX8499217.1 hypothetical protein [Pseudomonas lijiangensis]MBX8504796.1 hypothetical protein [Pseudomonas lijiangensis]MBX8508988.1 hypothetical protein [Pseudomonas cichorii]MBX8524551.1 hypothetical protein [Pseudomonas cichorii]
MLKAIQDRTRQLGRISDQASPKPELVKRAIDQSKFDAGFTGGRYAGSNVSCEFVPQADAYAYGCFGTRFHQNKNRVCSLSQDRASGDLYQTLALADIVDRKPKLILTCKPGIKDCAEGSSGWNAWSDIPDADTQRIFEQIDVGEVVIRYFLLINAVCIKTSREAGLDNIATWRNIECFSASEQDTSVRPPIPTSNT